MDLDSFKKQEDVSTNFEDTDKNTLSARERNELAASLIKKQIGDLEQVRALLGLNKKRMCELLLIDPSTWTRWTTGKTEPPPWLYRSLQWGVAVMDKYPEFHPLLINQKIVDSKGSNTNIDSGYKDLAKEVSSIKKDLKIWMIVAFGAASASFLLTAYILIYL